MTIIGMQEKKKIDGMGTIHLGFGFHRFGFGFGSMSSSHGASTVHGCSKKKNIHIIYEEHLKRKTGKALSNGLITIILIIMYSYRPSAQLYQPSVPQRKIWESRKTTWYNTVRIKDLKRINPSQWRLMKVLSLALSFVNSIYHHIIFDAEFVSDR